MGSQGGGNRETLRDDRNNAKDSWRDKVSREGSNVGAGEHILFWVWKT
jgi:hypothetical protein